MCIKGKRINIYIYIYRRKILGRMEFKKKKSNSKKSGEGHTCLGWRGNQKTPWLEKKKTETNEDMVDKQMKKKKIVGKIEKVR